MKRQRNHKAEQLLAWFAVIVIAAMVITGFVFLFIKIQNPLKEKAASLWQDINTVKAAPEEEQPAAEEENPAEEFLEEEPVEQTLEAEDIEELFEDTAETEEPLEETAEEPLEPDENLQRAEEIVEGMSLQQKVCQLFMVTPEAITKVDPTTAAGEKTRLALKDYPVGGIILFKKNLEDAKQLKEMTGNLQRFSEEAAGVPLFIGIDEEGGKVTRIAGNELFEIENTDTMQNIGSTGDTEKARETGAYIGAYLKEYGINLDMAPDADVVLEGAKSSIGDRSFGSDPEMVGEMALAYMEGLKDSGVAGVPKHFPGHGAVAEDTHDAAAITEKDWGELAAFDLIPFQKLINGGARFLMVAHISVPKVTGDEIPASMSGIILTNKLRLEMGYKGIIMTDALNMGAVANNYECAEAVIESIKAGVDIILMPKDFETAYMGVMTALDEGIVSEQRINESCIRIVKTKLDMASEAEINNVEE